MPPVAAPRDQRDALHRARAALDPNIATLTLPVRALIVAETLDTPLYPREFAKRWDLKEEAVARHFRRMAEDGFLELVREPRPPNARGRGRPGQRYRARKAMLFWTGDWEKLSLADREGHSYVVFITLVAQISLAINAKTLDQDLDRHFTWKGLTLDRMGWSSLMKRLDDVLDWVLVEEVEAGLRLERSKERPTSAIVALAGFRSPSPSELAAAPQVAGSGAENASLEATGLALGPDATALPLPERSLILAEAWEGPVSSSGFAEKWHRNEIVSARHFRSLAKAGYLDPAGEMQPRGNDRRGRRAQLYTATKNLLLPTQDWKMLSQEEREGHSFVVYITLVSRLSMAIRTRTMDMDLDRHLTWKALTLDRLGWEQLGLRLDDVLDWVMAEEKLAERRMRESGEPGIPTTVALAGIRSPNRCQLFQMSQAM